MSCGDWGLGIGPIPNPQYPIPNIKLLPIKVIEYLINYKLKFLLLAKINNNLKMVIFRKG